MGRIMQHMTPYEYRLELVQKLIKAMEDGTPLWQMSLGLTRTPFNPVSGTIYRGINAINLMQKSYEYSCPNDPRWCTFSQANSMKWTIKKGAKGTRILYYQPAEEKHDSDFDDDTSLFPQNEDEEDIETGINTDDNVQKQAVIHYYTVFHAFQIEGIPPYKAVLTINTDKAERIIRSSKAIIKYKGITTIYNLAGDYIQVPSHWQFSTSNKYYFNVLHGLVHWTGHHSRLKRSMIGKYPDVFAREELVAEIASMLISSEIGITPTQEHIDNHAAYINSWIKQVKEDHKVLFHAIHEAQKAANYLLQYEHVREAQSL